jgi:hypothetical protein
MMQEGFSARGSLEGSLLLVGEGHLMISPVISLTYRVMGEGDDNDDCPGRADGGDQGHSVRGIGTRSANSLGCGS